MMRQTVTPHPNSHAACRGLSGSDHVSDAFNTMKCLYLVTLREIFICRFRFEPVQNPFARVREFAEPSTKPTVQFWSKPESEPKFQVRSGPVQVRTEVQN